MQKPNSKTTGNNNKFENVVFIVDGGLGKCIMATVVVRNIKKKYPDKKLIVICGYPDVFLNNPHVHKVYSFGNALYFYRDYIEDSKSLILKIEPYLHIKYLYREWHLTHAWCETLGVPFDKDLEGNPFHGSGSLCSCTVHCGPPGLRLRIAFFLTGLNSTKGINTIVYHIGSYYQSRKFSLNFN